MTTLNEAAAAIESMARAGANSVQVQDWQAELEEARREASGVAEKYIGNREQEFIEARQTVLEDGTALRDELERLAASAESGPVDIEVYAEQFQTLQAQVRAYRRREEELLALVEQLEAIEEDPINWVDTTFYAKYPTLGPRFTFR